ncbi:hypothetical protein B0H17DRAFT_1149057 [Mycena rosella]|uniref:Uncharacterized protein n=1 Tax=Mycena rosella TaxID=1033263 RepID=A0AAD7FVY4_MYCRO|nr:hypothetical protein B0H17DRAFT_1149057 [Mycena rosella]
MSLLLLLPLPLILLGHITPPGGALGMDGPLDDPFPADVPAPSNATSETAGAFEKPIVEARLLYVHVTVEWTERAKPIDVLATSPVEFIPIALSAHEYQDTYIAGVESGPGIQVWWAGSWGGKSGAALVLFNDDWEIITAKLKAALELSKKTRHWFQPMFEACSLDPYEPELTYGTRVRNSEHCTPAEIALVRHLLHQRQLPAPQDELISPLCVGSGHYTTQASKQCTPSDPSPDALLTAWTGASTSASTSKPCGHTGPFPDQQPPTASTSTSDTTNLLLTTMVPVMAMMAQNMASNIPRAPAPTPLVLLIPPHSPMAASSPPPDIEDNLTVFMDAFCARRSLTPSSTM